MARGDSGRGRNSQGICTSALDEVRAGIAGAAVSLAKGSAALCSRQPRGQREGAALGCGGSQDQSSLLEGRFFMNVRKEKRRINECEGWG